MPKITKAELQQSLEWSAIREEALRKAGNEWKDRADAAEAEVVRLTNEIDRNADIKVLVESRLLLRAEAAEAKVERLQAHTVAGLTLDAIQRADAAEAEVERLTARLRDLEHVQVKIDTLLSLKARAEAAEAKAARVEALHDALVVLGNLPIEKEPDGLTASVEACKAVAGDLRDALDGVSETSAGAEEVRDVD